MTKANPPLRFLTFEGGEGAGKTTLIDRVEKMLISRGVSVVRTREPGGSRLGEQVRHWLLTRDTLVDVGMKAELLLFLAARAQHIEEVIEPAIRAGKVVLCDRFNDSTIAYQGAARGLGVEMVKGLCKAVCGDIVPDLTLYLDVTPEIGLARTRQASKEQAFAGEVDRIEAEKIQFHRTVREAFLAIHKEEPTRFYLIDANKPQNSVWKAALKIIEEKFNIHKGIHK